MQEYNWYCMSVIESHANSFGFGGNIIFCSGLIKIGADEETTWRTGSTSYLVIEYRQFDKILILTHNINISI